MEFPGRVVRRLGTCIMACLAILLAPDLVRANTITVNSTADVIANDGLCTLREAIIAANTNTASGAAAGECAAGAAGLDTIAFNIPGGGVQTITLTLGNLPDITEPVVIDGTMQPGTSANTLVIGDNAVLAIVVNLRFLSGFSFKAGAAGSTLRGLVVNNSPNSGTGIIVAADNVAIEGNFIGTDAAGAVASPTNIGILVNGGSNTRIGGTLPAQRNLISGTNNAGFGNGWGIAIELAGNGTLIQGNYIGTDATGTLALANTTGILIDPVGATSIGDVTIGGTASGAGNLISGNNPDSGINLATGDGGASIGVVTIQGNIIGLDATGTVSLPNHFGVINHLGAGGARGELLIGGATAAARNIISGGDAGIYNELDTSMVIMGNYIGTDITGTVGMGGLDGIDGIGGSVAIGTSGLGHIGGISGNLISGNAHYGIRTTGAAVIQGNLIGTKANGVTPLPNGQTAVLIQGGPTALGGTGAGEGNRIVHVTTDAGVIDQGGSQAAIRGNSISANGAATELGISLGNPFFVTPNDDCDGDFGSNGQQNFPVITSAAVVGGGITIDGTLNSTANTTFSIDFYSNVSCSPLGNGEGLTFLGSTTAVTDGTCNGTFSAVLPAPPPGQAVITATATDPANNTSEFSACLSAALPPARVFVSISGNDADPCGLAAPCRTFTRALTQVAPGGEIVVLNSGGYGPFTVGQAVSIVVPQGIYAGVTASSGDAITVSAGPTDVVSLRGLTINSLGGVNGIRFVSGAALQLEGCSISGFADGLRVEGSGDLSLVDVRIRYSTSAAVDLLPASPSHVVALRCRFENASAGLAIESAAHVELTESVVSGNTGTGVSCAAGDVTVNDCLISRNGTGIAASGSGTARVTDSCVTDNTTGIAQSGGGTLLSRNDSTVEGNGVDTSGTIGSYTAK
jgi:CSLREA domain-containing protein